MVLTYPFNSIIVMQPLFCHYLLMLFDFFLYDMFSRMSKLPFFVFYTIEVNLDYIF